MDLNEIQKLANLVKDTDLQELEIERGDMRLKIVNHGGIAYPVQHIPPIALPAKENSPALNHLSSEKDQPASVEDLKNFHIIKSPIVGTFYSAPSPEAPDFVTIGMPVSNNSTVCIIEAMKVMNEIQAETQGTIAEILVQNGQPVEFGQPLFKIKKS